MSESLPCLERDESAAPLHAIRPAGVERFLAGLAPAQAAFARAAGFGARAQELVLLPGPQGVAGALLGLGEDRSPHAFGDLAYRLPEASWRLEAGDYDAALAVLGFALGAYRYQGFKAPPRAPARLVTPAGHQRALSEASAIWMVRDLINTPANVLGPAELADAAERLAAAHGAAFSRVTGAALENGYPALAAVGRASARAPQVALLRWTGSAATATAPLVSLCGKGVVFDSGGLDLKPSAGMLRMKKDMGGAATVLGIARVLMEADLPIRLAVRLGCVENSVSGSAFRPGDVVRTRSGRAVEIGNTDAEGRLVLADLLHDACEERPGLLIDCATLTGAARVALGPDLPALFTDHDDLAARLLGAGTAVHDPLWRLPLWAGYDGWLESPIGDFNNVSSKPMAGAIVAALFLRRFVPPDTAWAHLDLYAWNDTTRPGRPEGGEAQALRAVCCAVASKLEVTTNDRNTVVT